MMVAGKKLFWLTFFWACKVQQQTTLLNKELMRWNCLLLNIRDVLTLNAPIAAKVVCFSRLLKFLRSLYGKQCVPRSDCSWVRAVFFYT